MNAPGLMMIASALIAGRMDSVDKHTLMVTLQRLQDRAHGRPQRRQLRYVVSQRCGAVDVGLAMTKQIQIGSVQEQHSGRLSSLSVPGRRRTPARGSPL